MLFGKKKNKEIENAAVEESVEKAESTQESTEAHPEVKAPSAEVFSARIATVFSQMYRLIISVDALNNVYQVESGIPVINGKEIPVRGYYDKLYEELRSLVFVDDVGKLENFQRKHIYDTFLTDKTFLTDLLCIELDDKDEDESNFQYYELRAVKMPSKDIRRVRFILFFKPVVNEEDNGQVITKKVKKDLDWSDIRFRKLLSGGKTIYFEYEVTEDVMNLHLTDGMQRVIKKYLQNLDGRSDHTIFHDDTKIVRKAIKNAIAGKRTESQLRYRADGNHEADFHLYSLICAPAEDEGKVEWVVGALNDIENETQRLKDQSDVKQHIDKMVDALFVEMVEIDTDKDLYTPIRLVDDKFVMSEKSSSYSGKIRDMIHYDRFDEPTRELAKRLMKKEFLEHRMLDGNCEFEMGIRDVGVQEFKYYLDTYYTMSKQHHYLRVRRDITENREKSRIQYALEEQERVAEQNRYMLDTLASLVEFRNVESGSHITHVCRLTAILLEDLMNRCPEYKITKKMVSLYSEAAILHDIGKITVPDYILNKPEKLTDEEFTQMKRHTKNGAEIVKKITMPGQKELKECCYEVALGHHERWDGQGYPNALKGDEIPIGVQAVGLADCYDAMVSVRCYKESLSQDSVVEYICEGNCGVFNPKLLASLQACAARLRAVYDDEEFRKQMEE